MPDNSEAPLILLCEDEVPILRVTELKLKHAGYRVVCAMDGVEGWEKIVQEKPDLLITDCQMPRMDGMQLLAQVRSCPETADLPVALLTAKGFELDNSPVEQFNALAVIDKPFSPRELLSLVDDVFNRSDQTAGSSADSEY